MQEPHEEIQKSSNDTKMKKKYGVP